ncbi:MAG TPA: ABC transporter permease [Puia sp.]|jgi:putative ABC transport system permease protein|nr:ABC transporter permease [Puia sp.]
MNSLKPAFRHFRKYPAFSLINLGGLSIGIAASFVLLVYTQREFSTDRHFRDAGRIARIGTNFYQMGPFALSQSMLRDLAIASCKDVEDATAIQSEGETPIRTNTADRAFTGITPYCIDSSFFHIFSYETAAGFIPRNGPAPGEAILSTTQATKFFGKADPIGKTIFIDKDMKPAKVIAVLKESFAKSHLDPQILLHRDPSPDAGSAVWTSCSLYNYVKLKPAGSIAGLNTWLDRVREKIVYPSVQSTKTYDQWKTSGEAISFIVQPLTDIYFHSDLKFDLTPGGNLTQVQLLSAISLLLILLAVINYVNLVTARSSVRAKEIGLKKTFGAPRLRLIAQMLKESILFSTIAMVFSCGLIQIVLFGYSSLTGSALTGPIPFLSANYLWLILFSVAVGVVAGIYPALYLTGIRPGLIIRSTSGSGRNRSFLRNSLVTLQLAIAIGLLFVSFVIYSQLQYMKNKDKGFRSDGLVVVQNAGELKDRLDAFRQLIDRQSQVASTSICSRTPAGRSIIMGSYKTTAMQQPLFIQEFPVDDRYIGTLGLHLTDGRNFNKDLLSDTNSLILNQAAVSALGLFHPVGSVINGSQRVIGVVKDFNFVSLHEKVHPALLKFSSKGGNLSEIIIRVQGGHPADFLAWLQHTGREFLPDTHLDVSFIDDNFGRLAEKERLLGQAINFFTALAILLATLGLIGLTLFTIERRTKEIGIRKVLGAGTTSILKLISGDFIRLAAIASAIAIPVAWWLVDRWLNNFAYRITIGPSTILLTVALIGAIALAVISLLTLRALIANPVNNLRTE